MIRIGRKLQRTGRYFELEGNDTSRNVKRCILGPKTAIDRKLVELNFQHCQRVDSDGWVNFEFSQRRNEKFMSLVRVRGYLPSEQTEIYEKEACRNDRDSMLQFLRNGRTIVRHYAWNSFSILQWIQTGHFRIEWEEKLVSRRINFNKEWTQLCNLYIRN